MKRITLAFLLLFSITIFAQSQEGINYKALIKDVSGAVVANTTIDVRFSIQKGGMFFYQETHTPTTDANGIVILTIGDGTPINGSPVFSTLDWSSNDHTLNVQLNTQAGTGLTNMGTTPFQTVPYALSAKTVQNISGTTNFVPKSIDGTAIGDSQLFDNGTNVGIGTTTPLSKLDLRVNGIGLRQQLDDTSPSIGFWTDEFGAALQTHNDSPLLFATNNGATQMTLSTAGNLGIGTTSPLFKMDLRADGIGFSQQVDAVSPSIGFYTNSTGAWMQTHNDFPLLFTTNDGATQMTLSTTGNLGIGVPAPTAKLDVAGNLKITDGTQGAGKVLTSDADGLASWDDNLLNLITDLQAQITALEAQIPPAAIGDLRAGGVVFWVDPADNTHGLVCAMSDYAGTREWGCYGTDLPSVPNVTSFPLAGPGAEIGDGITNTNGILTDCHSAPAALAARSYGPEWFLPSAKELNEMYLNKPTLEAVAGFTPFTSFYWSSTEGDDRFAWRQYFNGGNQGLSSKDFTYYVRAVRAF